MECCKDGDWEHVVIPTVVYELYKPQFDAAGFEKAPDLRQFATQDGLKEALLGGADFNKKWE
jgi:hypothetical protein